MLSRELFLFYPALFGVLPGRIRGGERAFVVFRVDVSVHQDLSIRAVRLDGAQVFLWFSVQEGALVYFFP